MENEEYLKEKAIEEANKSIEFGKEYGRMVAEFFINKFEGKDDNSIS